MTGREQAAFRYMRQWIEKRIADTERKEPEGLVEKTFDQGYVSGLKTALRGLETIEKAEEGAGND